MAQGKKPRNLAGRRKIIYFLNVLLDLMNTLLSSPDKKKKLQKWGFFCYGSRREHFWEHFDTKTLENLCGIRYIILIAKSDVAQSEKENETMRKQMVKVEIFGGFHNQLTPIRVMVPTDWKERDIQDCVSEKTMKKIQNHICGLRSCCCGGVYRANILAVK